MLQFQRFKSKHRCPLRLSMYPAITAACSPDMARPILARPQIIEHDKEKWLVATDSYIAVAMKVPDVMHPGAVPLDAAKLLDKGKLGIQNEDLSWSSRSGRFQRHWLP